MSLRLAKLQELDGKTPKFRAIAEVAEGFKDIDGIFYY